MSNFLPIFCSWIILTLPVFGLVGSTSGNLGFDINDDGVNEAHLSDKGLEVTSNLSSATLSVGSNVLPSSNLGIHGTVEVSYQTISASTDELMSSYVIAETTSSNIWVELPNPALSPGRIHHFIKPNSSNNLLISSNTYIDTTSTDRVLVESGAISLLSISSSWVTLTSRGVVSNEQSFAPTSLGNLLAWYDASNSNSLSLDGNKLTQWNDLSGNDYHLTPNINKAGFVHPITGNEMNGVPALQFSGNASGNFSYMRNLNFDVPTSGNMAMFVVARPEENGHDLTYSGMFAMNSNVPDFQYEAAHVSQFRARNTFKAIDNSNNLANNTIDYMGGNHIFTAIFDFDNSVLKSLVDSQNEATALYDNTLANNNLSDEQDKDLFIGANRGQSACINGLYAECIICEDIDDASRYKIEGYLAWKWGLESQLPSGHPYKDQAP